MTAPKRAIARGLVITPHGHDILRQVAAVTYAFAPSGVLKAGRRMHKGKRRSKFIGARWAK